MTPARLVAALLAALATVTVTFTTAGLVVTTALDGSDLEAAEAEAERSVAAGRTSTWTAVSGVVTRLADTETVVVVAALVLALAWWARRRRVGLYVVAAVVGETLAFLLITLVVDRERPPVPQLDIAPPTSSFPSGHTAASVALYGSLAVVAWRLARSALLRWAATVGAVVVPVAVAASRLYRGMHWPTDLVGGALLGLVWLVVTTRLLAPGSDHRRGPSSG